MDDHWLFRTVHMPRCVRVGPRASRELADDAARLGITRTILVVSHDLPTPISTGIRKILHEGGIQITATYPVSDGSIEATHDLIPPARDAQAVIGLGGGRAIDVAKYVASQAEVPFISVPTSLSNDGFAAPAASLTTAGKRSSFPCSGPAGVIVDTTLCAAAPPCLFAAGVGDVVAKLTALNDWTLAEHAGGEKVDGAAAAIALASVAELEVHPIPDEQGHLHLARALLLGGTAMALAGSSRPASGSEHLISHALDRLLSPPRSHGLQVGCAAYLMSHLQNTGDAMTSRLAAIFSRVGFWPHVAAENIPRNIFIEALHLAPTIKDNFPTVLSRPGAIARATDLIKKDPTLRSVLHS